jgi:hypothetical protein
MEEHEDTRDHLRAEKPAPAPRAVEQVQAEVAALSTMWNLLHAMIGRNGEILKRVEQWESLRPPEEAPQPPAA